MTLGTPHQGIGAGPLGDFSTFFANACANVATVVLEPYTCYESDTAGRAVAPGTGNTVRILNLSSVPALQTALTPQYDVIIGQRLGQCVAGVLLCSPQSDDGLITTAGNQMCGGSLVNPLDVCSGLTGGVLTEINPNVAAQSGLCHSGGVLLASTCSNISASNIAMAAVDDTGHPLWNEICQYLGCAPAINVTLSDPAKGVVTSAPTGINCGPSCSPPGINCGSTCTALFASGTMVTLTAAPSTGNIFTGWNGACTGSAVTCVLTVMNYDADLTAGYQVTANFSAAGGVTYTYTGNPFTTVGPSSSISPTPCPCPPLTSISGSFTVSQPLPRNMGNAASLTDITSSIVSFNFTDGRDVFNTLSNTAMGNTFVLVATNASADIIAWRVFSEHITVIGTASYCTGPGSGGGCGGATGVPYTPYPLYYMITLLTQNELNSGALDLGSYCTQVPTPAYPGAPPGDDVSPNLETCSASSTAVAQVPYSGTWVRH